MKVTRRQVLAAGVAGATATAVAGIAWWERGPEEGRRCLTQTEAAVVRAIAAAAYPAVASEPALPAGETLNLDVYLDEVLWRMPRAPQKQLRALISGLELAPGSRFSRLPGPERDRALATWLESDIDPLRLAVQSLVLLVGMGWSTHPAVAPRFARHYPCGYGR